MKDARQGSSSWPCWPRLLTGTKRMLGRVTDSQMASASAASFLPRLPERRGDDGLGCHQAQQHGFACGVHAVNGKNVPCQIDANGYECHGLPLPTNE